MFDFLNFFRKKNSRKFREKTLAEIKDSARILIIDDRRPSLVEDLEREGWRVKYIDDLESYRSTDLVDSHIICLDIIGVGKKLRCDSGLDLVKGIKGEYPEKKILLYSSVSSHNIFDESIDLVDKRILKDGQPYQFLHAVQELSYQVFDWKQCVRDIYDRYKSELGVELSLDEFEKRLQDAISSDGTLDIDKVSKCFIVSLQVSNGIAKLLKTVLA